MRPLHVGAVLAIAAVAAVIYVFGVRDERAKVGRRGGASEVGETAAREERTDTPTLRGRVFDAEGRPVAGAVVEALRIRSGFLYTEMSRRAEVAAHTRSGKDGGYALRAAADDYHLRARAPGHAPALEIRVAVSADTRLDLHLRTGVEVNGRVRNRQGLPVPGALVLFAPMSVLLVGGPTLDTVTGRDGSFSLFTLPDKSALVVVRAEGYATYMNPETELGRGVLDITLDLGHSLRLRAIDKESRAPVARVSVTLYQRRSLATGSTGEDGVAVLAHVGTSGESAALFLVSTHHVARHLPLEQGVLDVGDVELERGGIVRGRVLDEATRAPIANATVSSTGSDESFGPQVRSATDGSFELRGVPLDATHVTAEHADYVSLATEEAGPLFEDRREIEVDVMLRRAGAVTGVVHGPDGQPVAGARVSALDENPLDGLVVTIVPVNLGARTDAEGHFRLGGLDPEAEVRLVARHPRFGDSAAVTAKPGAEVTLRLTEPLTVAGRLLDERGEPVTGVKVRAQPETSWVTFPRMASPNAADAVTDADGRYVLNKAPRGDLVMLFEHPDYAPLEKKIGPSGRGQRRDVGDVVLKRGLSIEGVVVDPNGKPAVDVEVGAEFERGLSDTGRTGARARTDGDGRFVLRGLAQGGFTVRVAIGEWYAEPARLAAGTRNARITLERPGRLDGRITSGGVPVAGAVVMAVQPGVDTKLAGLLEEEFMAVEDDEDLEWIVEADPEIYLEAVRTRGDGSFTLKRVPPRRAFAVLVRHPRHEPGLFEGVRAGQRREFTLKAGRRIAGVVIDRSNRPMEGASVTIEFGEREREAVTDERGRFAFTGLPTGPEIRIRAAGAENAPEEEGVVVARDKKDLRLTVVRGLVTSGVLSRPNGAKITFARITALDVEGNHAADTFIFDAKGMFEMPRLLPGVYTLHAQAMAEVGDVTAEVKLPGVAAGSKNVEIRFPR